MALETAVVRATTPSTTGTVDFTSSGFGTPVAAIFFMCWDAADNTVNNDTALLSVGFTDGTNDRCAAFQDEDGLSTSNANRKQQSSVLVQLATNGSSVQKQGNFNSWITDGVRLDWTVSSGTAQFDVVCVLIKGVSAQVGSATLSASNGGTVSPSTSFAVDAVFSLGVGAGNDTLATFGLINFGCAVDDGSLTQRCASFTVHDNESANVMQAELSEQAFTQQLVSNARTWYADVTAFNSGSNGFTVTSRGSTSSDTFSYLAISNGGSNLSLQTVSSPTSTGTQNYSVTGTPHTAIGAMTNAAAVNTVQTAGPGAEGISIFAAEDGTGEYSVEVGDDDAASTSATWNLQATKLIDKRYSSSGTVTAHVAASVNAWNSGALQLNWTTVDASARKGWVLIASDSGGSTFTGSGTLSAAAAITSGSGTHTAPVYTGSGTPSAAAATCAGSGTFTAPVYAGSGALTASTATTAGSGTHTAPVYTGSGTISTAAATCSGSGTVTGPGTVTGSGALAAASATASGAGTHTAPVYTGSGALAVASATTSGTGAFWTNLATGALSAAAATCAGTGTHTASVSAVPTVYTPVRCAEGQRVNLRASTGNRVDLRGGP